MNRASGAFAAAAALMLMGVRQRRLPWLERAAEPRRASPSALSRSAQPPAAFARLGSLWADGSRQCLVPMRFSAARAGFSPQLRVCASATRRDVAAVLIPIALPKPANDGGGEVAVALEAAPMAHVRVLPKGAFKAFRAKRAQTRIQGAKIQGAKTQQALAA